MSQSKNCYPQIWAGLECSINRVENSFFDQLDYSGFYKNEELLHSIAALGIKAFRYPVLWERHQKTHDDEIDFAFDTRQLNILRQYDVEPIIGLIHHGSGPAFTDLSDPHFAELFASYAEKVAKQFPAVKYFTPVNEPLTTARFSGLYGHWYPHKRNDADFCRIFLNEMKAIVLAMEAIRRINPEAMLIQTEDLGETFSTPGLKYQADFENQRRWLTYDILCGKLDCDHPMWSYLRWVGISEHELYFFTERFSVPDIIGLNHYITSERFIDEDREQYPSCFYGSNHVQEYADLEAARVNHSFNWGIKNLLRQTSDRYSIPLAITEIHMHCHREHQLRWLKEIWEECVGFNKTGGDVTAITAWSLLGSYGWDKLLTRGKGNYECGVFDLRSKSKPRATALAHSIQTLSQSIS